jgi:succinate-acetate transporter protein
MRESVKELVDHITTNEPTFPSEHSYRQGNATLLGLIGFIGATLTSSLVELFAPNASSQPVWLWFIGFGGVLQVIAAEHELLMGNSLTATIFATYGFHWIGAGVLSGHLVIFQSVTPPDNPGTSIGCYYIFLTLATISYTGCAIFNPRGSWLLVWTLIAVIMKLVFLVIDAWYEDEGITRTAGFFGTLASLLALYAFVADAVSEFGQTTLPTGKFGVGVISRQEIREEIDEALAAED